MFAELDWGNREVCVRINKVGSGYSEEDLDFVKRESKVTSIILPKADEIPRDIRKKTGKFLLPLIETAKGVLRVEDIVRCEGVEAVSYGPADLAYSVGGRTEAYSQNLYVKTRIVVAASAYGVNAIDSVFFDSSRLAWIQNRSRAVERLRLRRKAGRSSISDNRRKRGLHS